MIEFTYVLPNRAKFMLPTGPEDVLCSGMVGHWIVHAIIGWIERECDWTNEEKQQAIRYLNKGCPISINYVNQFIQALERRENERIKLNDSRSN